jgi:CubicO group peptidase (beta-lactamase class C family)
MATRLRAMTTLDRSAVDALLDRTRRDVDTGLLPSCQVALALDGEVLVHEAFGDATPDTRYTIFSATKPFVASLVWQMLGDGVVTPDLRVSELIPEFGSNGKDEITLDHVLQHTAGFPHAPLGAPLWDTHDGRRQAFAAWRLNWPVGSQYEYHPTSAHWVLAELVERLSDADYRDIIRARITEPLGIPRLQVGAPEDQQDDIADVAIVGEAPSPDELFAIIGVRELPVTEVTDEAKLSFNDKAVRALGVPGGGGVMSAADLALYYQGLLHNPGGLWDADVLADATSNVRNTMKDPWFGVPANRTLGLVVAGDDGKANMRGFGKTQSPRTFGHNGAGGQLAWADPESGLSFCYFTNGHDANVIREARRGVALNSLAAVCAG